MAGIAKHLISKTEKEGLVYTTELLPSRGQTNDMYVCSVCGETTSMFAQSIMFSANGSFTPSKTTSSASLAGPSCSARSRLARRPRRYLCRRRPKSSPQRADATGRTASRSLKRACERTRQRRTCSEKMIGEHVVTRTYVLFHATAVCLRRSCTSKTRGT